MSVAKSELTHDCGDANSLVAQESVFPTFQILFPVLKFLKLVSAAQIHIQKTGSTPVDLDAFNQRFGSEKGHAFNLHRK